MPDYTFKPVPPSYDLPANSPLLHPKTCPTHLNVEGYGTIPVQVATQSWYSSKFTQVVPDIAKRVLHVSPTRPSEVARPTTPHLGITLASLIGVSIGAGLIGFAIATHAPIAFFLGATLWVFCALFNIANAHRPPEFDRALAHA